MIEFGIEAMRQLAVAKAENRLAANLLAAEFGNGDGIVLCVRAAASLLDEMYDSHTTHGEKVAIAQWMRKRMKRVDEQVLPDATAPRKGRARRQAAPLPGASPPGASDVHNTSGDGGEHTL